MGRYVLWALGVVLGIALSAAPAAAQVDIGVWTPNGGGRVVLGGPVYYPAPVYYPPPVYVYPAPRVYVDPFYYRPYFRRGPVRGYPPGQVKKFGRSYYGSSRFSRGNAYGRSYLPGRSLLSRLSRRRSRSTPSVRTSSTSN